MKKCTICIVQHSPLEPPGRIGDALQAEHLAWEVAQVTENQILPKSIDSYEGLILMGGPMSVYGDKTYPWLREGIGLIQQALEQRKPILGVCLGSQLLASALGASVTAGKQKEIGWFPVRLNDFAPGDALWQGVPRSFTAFHWHGDVFELPAGAVPLAQSDVTACQAFRYGSNAYGLLFHCEVTQSIIGGMVKTFAEELRQAGISPEEILNPMPTYLPSLHHIGATVFQRWARLVRL